MPQRFCRTTGSRSRSSTRRMGCSARARRSTARSRTTGPRRPLKATRSRSACQRVSRSRPTARRRRPLRPPHRGTRPQSRGPLRLAHRAPPAAREPRRMLHPLLPRHPPPQQRHRQPRRALLPRSEPCSRLAELKPYFVADPLAVCATGDLWLHELHHSAHLLLAGRPGFGDRGEHDCAELRIAELCR